MLGGRKITATLKGGILYETCCPQRGILLPLLCCLVVDEVIEDLDGNGCFKLGNVLSSSVENSQSVSQLLWEALSIEQQSCGKHQLRIHSEKDQHLGQSLMKPRQSEETSSHTFFSKCGAARCRKTRAAKKRLSSVKVHGPLMCPIFLYSILFHCISTLNPLTKP